MIEQPWTTVRTAARSGSRRPALAGGILLLLAAALLPGFADGQVLRDGIAAVVNGEIISVGEVRRTAALSVDARTDGIGSDCGFATRASGPPDGEEPAPGPSVTSTPTPQQLRSALECLIDTTLVFREVRRFPRLGVTDAQVRELMTQLEADFGSAEQLDDGLRQLGLLRSEVRSDLQRQLLIAAYIDDRFRATVEISSEEARRAWVEELAPDMRERGISPPAFEQVAEDLVVPLLREREVNRRVQSWIGDLRERASIERRFP